MNAVIYARYSSHSQTEQSIEGQLRDNYAWAQSQGITVVGEYIDRALTGTKDQRPDFQHMIDDASKKQFQMVIVWKLDRFARNRYDSAIYKARLKKYGVRVVSVKENITDAPEGIILEGLLESMAEYYSANLAQNIRRGQRENAAKGLYCGGSVPYGYKSVNKKLVADEKTAPAVRYLFEQYAQGAPMKQIIDELNGRGFRTRNGKPLCYSSFKRCMNNTAYIGRYVYNGVEVPGLAEPLIDEATFEKARERAKLIARAPAAKAGKVEYALQGKVFCGYCGSTVIGESGRSKSGGVYHYYACSKKKKFHTCTKKNERQDFLEWYVVDQTMKYILAPDVAAYVAHAVVKEYDKEFSDNRVEEYERALSQIDRELEKLVDAIVDSPKVAHQRIYARMEQLEARKADLEADLSRLRIAQNIRLTEAEVRAWLNTFQGGDAFDAAYRRRVIDTFINSVYLYEDKLIVLYNMKKEKQVGYSDLLASVELHNLSSCSTMNNNGGALSFKPEHNFIFVNGVFGYIFYNIRHQP